MCNSMPVGPETNHPPFPNPGKTLPDESKSISFMLFKKAEYGGRELAQEGRETEEQ